MADGQANGTQSTASDVPALTQFLNDAVGYKLRHRDSAWGSKGWTEQGVHEGLGRSEVYVVEEDGLLVATMSLSWQDEKYWGFQGPIAGYVHRVAVRDGLHSLGLGSFALDWSSDQVSDKGQRYLMLDCDQRNTSLCGYYESLGFMRVGTRPMSTLGDYVASLYERPVR